MTELQQEIELIPSLESSEKNLSEIILIATELHRMDTASYFSSSNTPSISSSSSPPLPILSPEKDSDSDVVDDLTQAMKNNLKDNLPSYSDKDQSIESKHTGSTRKTPADSLKTALSDSLTKYRFWCVRYMGAYKAAISALQSPEKYPNFIMPKVKLIDEYIKTFKTEIRQNNNQQELVTMVQMEQRREEAEQATLKILEEQFNQLKESTIDTNAKWKADSSKLNYLLKIWGSICNPGEHFKEAQEYLEVVQNTLKYIKSETDYGDLYNKWPGAWRELKEAKKDHKKLQVLEIPNIEEIERGLAKFEKKMHECIAAGAKKLFRHQFYLGLRDARVQVEKNILSELSTILKDIKENLVQIRSNKDSNAEDWKEIRINLASLVKAWGTMRKPGPFFNEAVELLKSVEISLESTSDEGIRPLEIKRNELNFKTSSNSSPSSNPSLSSSQSSSASSGIQKIKISVAQALLILIDNCREEEDLILLKRLYLCGANKHEDRTKITEILKNPILKNYEVSKDPETINNDPTRRYFETHLAFNTLKDKIKNLEREDLEFQAQLLLNKFDADFRSEINKIYDNKHISVDREAKEFSDAIEKLETNEHYKEFSKEDKIKISLLIQTSCTAIQMVVYNLEDMPMGEVFKEGYFLDKNRGRIAKVESKDAKNLTSNNFGLMKSYMVVPGGHTNTDIAYASMGFPSLRAADRSRFNPSAAWPVENFKGLVHPFSASISGTFLAQLRVLALLNRENCLRFKSHDKMANYLTCFMAFFLYNTGGHSLNEFFGVLSLRKVQSYFEKFIENFSEINLINLFYEHNKQAFDLALKSAIDYNKMILQRANLHRSLTQQATIQLDIKKVESLKKDPEFSFFGAVLPDEKKLTQPKQKSSNKNFDKKKKEPTPLTQAEEKVRIIREIQEGIQYYKNRVTKDLNKADILFVMLQAFARLDLNNQEQTSKFLSRFVRLDPKETDDEFCADINKDGFDKSPSMQPRVIHLITEVGDFINKYSEKPHLHGAPSGLELSDSKVGDKKSSTRHDDQSATIKALAQQYDRQGVVGTSQPEKIGAKTDKAPEPFVGSSAPTPGTVVNTPL